MFVYKHNILSLYETGLVKITRKRSKAINFCLSGGVLLAQPPLVIINVSSRATLESSYNLNTMQFAQLFRSFLSKKEEEEEEEEGRVSENMYKQSFSLN